MAYLGFDANTVEPADFTALPTGDYAVIITDSEFKDSKRGTQYLSLTYQVIEGQGKGRNLWHNLNLSHPNPKAQEIAQRELSAICRAVGKMEIQDSAELHNIPHRVHVTFVPAKDDFPEGNRIKKWMPYNNGNGGAAAPRQQPAKPAAATCKPQASAPPASKNLPWHNKKPKHTIDVDPEVRQEAVEDDMPF